MHRKNPAEVLAQRPVALLDHWLSNATTAVGVVIVVDAVADASWGQMQQCNNNQRKIEQQKPMMSAASNNNNNSHCNMLSETGCHHRNGPVSDS